MKSCRRPSGIVRSVDRRRESAGAARRQLQPVIAGGAFEVVDRRPRSGRCRRAPESAAATPSSRPGRAPIIAPFAEPTLLAPNRRPPSAAAGPGNPGRRNGPSRRRRRRAGRCRRTARRPGCSCRAARRPSAWRTVAAAAQHADAVGARIDQPAVEVAQLDPEPALAVNSISRAPGWRTRSVSAPPRRPRRA